MKKIFKYSIGFCLSFPLFAGLASCEKTQSYSELLSAEEKAVNWYLAQHRVSPSMPANGKFAALDNDSTAPYYRMDEDGFVYMQVVNQGDTTDRPQIGDRVYFVFERMNLNYFYTAGMQIWEGNSEDLDTTLGSTSLLYGNQTLTSTTQYGEGLQLPLKYLGYNSEVNLVVKSPMGLTSDASSCNGYVYNIRYFKAEY